MVCHFEATFFWASSLSVRILVLATCAWVTEAVFFALSSPSAQLFAGLETRAGHHLETAEVVSVAAVAFGEQSPLSAFEVELPATMDFSGPLHCAAERITRENELHIIVHNY